MISTRTDPRSGLYTFNTGRCNPIAMKESSMSAAGFRDFPSRVPPIAPPAAPHTVVAGAAVTPLVEQVLQQDPTPAAEIAHQQPISDQHRTGRFGNVPLLSTPTHPLEPDCLRVQAKSRNPRPDIMQPSATCVSEHRRHSKKNSRGNESRLAAGSGAKKLQQRRSG